MTITLTADATVLTLAEDLRWTDEAEWSPVEQSVERSITGALILSLADRGSAGRPITLAPPDENSAWMPRSALEQLMAWAAIPGRQMTLSIRGATRAVVFRHQDQPVLQAEPVVFYADPAGADPHLITIKLMQV